MNEGDLVVVTGKLDTRIREIKGNELAIGTLVLMDKDNMAWVLLPSGDFWRGPKREICPADEQLKVVPQSEVQTEEPKPKVVGPRARLNRPIV